MKTNYYTITTWESGAMAAGFGGTVDGGRQTVTVRQQTQTVHSLDKDNVIDLSAWRAANQEEGPQGQWEDSGDSMTEEPEPYAPRVRKSRRAMFTAELASTVGVVAALGALMIRVLVF